MLNKCNKQQGLNKCNKQVQIEAQNTNITAELSKWDSKKTIPLYDCNNYINKCICATCMAKVI